MSRAGHPSAIAGSPRVKLYPPHYFVFALACMAGLHAAWPIREILLPPATFAGIPIALAALLTAARAARRFRSVGTPVVPLQPATTLVTGGLYRFTRNPMYLGLVVALIGVAVLMGTLTPPLVIPVFVVVLTRAFIVREEAQLEEIFGGEYRAYRERVRRWL